MNVHLELLLYSFSVVCRGHFMKYYDHYILAQGGIHNITAFAVAFNNFFGGLIYQRVWFQLLWLR